MSYSILGVLFFWFLCWESQALLFFLFRVLFFVHFLFYVWFFLSQICSWETYLSVYNLGNKIDIFSPVNKNYTTIIMFAEFQLILLTNIIWLSWLESIYTCLSQKHRNKNDTLALALISSYITCLLLDTAGKKSTFFLPSQVQYLRGRVLLWIKLTKGRLARKNVYLYVQCNIHLGVPSDE